jgi:hypothetical protein
MDLEGAGAMNETCADGIVSSSVAALSRKIEAWRENRLHLNDPMPERLWQEAAALARTHGVHRICQTLGLGMKGLKSRTESSSVKRGQSKAGSTSGFVEVVGLGVGSGSPGLVELELESALGARLRLRDSEGFVDIGQVVESFFRSSR